MVGKRKRKEKKEGPVDEVASYKSRPMCRDSYANIKARWLDGTRRVE